MKSASSRSPSRRGSPPPPPPPRMSHRSPGYRRGRSPERRRRVDPQNVPGSRMSPPRSRERREFRPSPRSDMSFSQPPEFPGSRRSRSPLRESKRRSFSPKRKSPKRERRESERERSARPSMSRKRSRSKSPPVAVGPPIREGTSRLGPYSGPSEGPPPVRGYEGPEYPAVEPVIEVSHTGRSISSLAERFPGPSRTSYEGDTDRPVFRVAEGPSSELKKTEELSDRPVFRGPDGAGYDINELKKIKIDIRRNLPVTTSQKTDRSVLNPEDVVLVRRPDASLDGEFSAERQRRMPPDQFCNERRSPSPKSRRRLSPWEQEEANSLNHRRNKSEGIHPIFAREEIIQANERSKYEPGPSYEHRSVPSDEHQRVVAIVDNPPPQSSGAPRFESPGRYSSSRPPTYYSDRDHAGSSRDYGRSRDYERSHGPGSSYDPRDKNRDDHFERREDLRHDLESRRRDDSRYSSHGDSMRYDKSRDYRESERGSDLRMRIHEKRSDRHDDHDMGHRHPMDRHDSERDRERERRLHPSPPSDRRRGPPMDYGHMGDGERKMRGDMRMGPSSRRNDYRPFHPDPEFSSRPFHGSKPWDGNPEYVPKGRSYFEHDTRDDMRMPNRGRGMMEMRGRPSFRGVMRGGRPIRRPGGMPRGYMGGRGTGRRGGYVPRFKQSSPHWEHDLFDNASPGHGNNGFSK